MTDHSLKQKLVLNSQEYIVHNINLLEEKELAKINRLPFASPSSGRKAISLEWVMQNFLWQISRWCFNIF